MALALLNTHCGGRNKQGQDPPRNLNYRTNPAVYTRGTVIAPNLPSSSGGEVASYAVAPALPAGLILNRHTGVVTGTPDAVTPALSCTVTASNSWGRTTASLSVTVIPPQPAPVIIVQPEGQPVVPGLTGYFTVLASGPEPLSYQWLRNGTPVEGAISNSCRTPAVAQADSGTIISVVVSNAWGSVISQPATMLVMYGFAATGSMATARSDHTATLLPSGKVLIAGGFDANNGLATAELYDPAAGTFTATGNMATARIFHTATLLPSGKVLIAGGFNLRFSPGDLASAELYDPVAGTFTATGSLATARAEHTATLLPSGKVLIAGGNLASAELYDPDAETFTAMGSMATARSEHTATLLPSGKVLVAGGYRLDSPYLVASAELYDPVAGTFAAAGNLATARAEHTATLLPSGKVLIAGGNLASAELYDPDAGTFTAMGSIATARSEHTATLLLSGKVLIAGGGPARTELYDPVTGMFTPGWNLTTYRYDHTATLLPSGQVLIAGGSDGSGSTGYHASAELSDAAQGASPPLAGTFTVTGGLGNGPDSATLLPGGKVLIVAERGYFADPPFNSATYSALYDPIAGTFGSDSDSWGWSRSAHTATLLPTGKVLIAGGPDYSSYPNYHPGEELYDPVPGTHAATGSLGAKRAEHTATLLPDGKVLIVGGLNEFVGLVLASVELYDPVAGTFTPTGSLATARHSHTATLLPTGKVLIGGGDSLAQAGGSLASAELYDPAAGTFTATGSQATARSDHTATLLPSGKVLFAGGYGTSGDTVSAELYDPVAGTFAATGSLGTGRYLHTATLLPDGTVLIAGGSQSGSQYPGLASAEIYDPAAGKFAATGSMLTAWYRPKATLLPSGRVLVMGANYKNPSAELYRWW